MPCACGAHKEPEGQKASTAAKEPVGQKANAGQLAGAVTGTTTTTFGLPQIIAIVLSVLAIVLLLFSAYRVYKHRNTPLFTVVADKPQINAS